MDFSDDDEVLLPESISNYYFVDGEETPISFCVLPFRWKNGEDVEVSKDDVFLHGSGDGGLKIYKQVTEWKLELDGIQPVIYVLSKDQKWLQLGKPRKSYADMIRKILITSHCIHYLRKTPGASEEALWNHLKKEFSHFEVRPSPADLQDHLPFIQQMSQRDEIFAKCELLPKLQEGGYAERSAGNEGVLESKNFDFINDECGDVNEDAINNSEGSDSDEDEDCFDSACAICDNGGGLICCEGRCLRSFHAFKGAEGADVVDCKTLGYSRAQIEAIQNFLCPNCRFKQHQCFACGKLGSSDRSAQAEVFPCVSATCGHFYHPKCVAKLLNPKSESAAMEQETKITSGEPFVCPVHKCHVCKQGENKEVEELQFAVCRRCPISYHRKCLPSEICFADSDDDSDEDSDVLYRAWNNLLPSRILIFCMKHKIDPELQTPLRNHLKFPSDPTSEKKRLRVGSSSRDKILKKTSQDLLEEKATMKKPKLSQKRSLVPENGSASKTLKTVSSKADRASIEPKNSVKERRKIMKSREIESNESSKSLMRDMLGSKVEDLSAASTQNLIPPPEIDSETEKRIIAMVQNCPASSLTLDEFVKQKDIPSTHAYAARQIDKTVTLGKVQASVEAVKMALQKIDDGWSIEDAKTICEPAILIQIAKWRGKLSIYLSPFLHGSLYSSFGRHFTKVEKLKEIVDRLHCYVQGGDTIVDFCCGANDFSILMKEKLDAVGKRCSYRNFDIIPPKNDFNFVKRDWMKVGTHELPHGNQLIMGLNPPFGIKGALANKFIDKALEFRPKLIILIVPKETERLDHKRGIRYDLVWEDDQKLSGKAFYMPGNMDVYDKQIEQWNVSPPPLYLWSRPDLTRKHKEIAQQNGHFGNSDPDRAVDAAMETQIPSQKETQILTQKETEIPTKITHVTTQMDTHVTSQMETRVPSQIETRVPSQMETKVSPVREEKAKKESDKIEACSKEDEKKVDVREAKLNERKVEVREDKPKERKVDGKDDNKQNKRKADVSEDEPEQKKESGATRRKRRVRKKQKESKKQKTSASDKEASDGSPRETGVRMGTSSHVHEEGHTKETPSRMAASQHYGDTYESLKIKEDDSKQPIPPHEVGHPLGGIYNRDTHAADNIHGQRRSPRETYQGYVGHGGYGLAGSVGHGYAGGSSYGLDRSIDGLHADMRRYDHPRPTDTLGSTRTYGMPGTGYGTSVSGLGLSGLPSATSYGFGDPTIGSSVTDRYASSMSPGLPNSSLGSSVTDRYASRLDDPTFLRNSGTPEMPHLGRGSLYGTPGAQNGNTPAYQPGSRYLPSSRYQ